MVSTSPYSFQFRIAEWGYNTFLNADSITVRVRSYRFLEEAIELCQAVDMPKEDAYALVDYVYGRPKGDPPQEVGGVLVTLAFLCYLLDLNMEECGEDEYRRINTEEMMNKIRAKDANKPLQGPPSLPGVA